MIRKLFPNDQVAFEEWASRIPQSIQFNWSFEGLLESFRHDRVWGYWDSTGGLRAAVALSHPTMERSEILWLATEPQFQGQGIMGRLLRAIVNDAKSQSVSRGFEIALEVHEKNLGALKLYSTVGFVEVRRRKNYYKEGGDALVMALKLP